jgi:hypothetical protein
MLSWEVFEGSADTGSLWVEMRPPGNMDGDRHKLQGLLTVGTNLDPDRRVSHGGLSDVVTVLFHAIACSHVGALTKQGLEAGGQGGWSDG